MKIGFLIIATEILEGKITDLNGKFLSEFLKPFQLEVSLALTVRDIEADILEALDFLLASCDVVVTSGGLGPTQDDLTKDVLGKFMGRVSGYSTEADAIARENYQRLNRPYPGKEHTYSQLPGGFTALSNSAGFAPGIFSEHQGKHVFCAPGVPREFKAILHDHMGPWIGKNHSPEVLMENVVIRTKKVPEEKIFGEVDPRLWEKLSAFGDVSSLPILMGVDIGVKVKASSHEELRLRKSEVLSIIKSSPVNASVWQIGSRKLEEVIVALANEKGLTYGFAESCTGGLCSNRVTNVPGSSQTFLGSVISYDSSVKTAVLNVPQDLIQRHGVVSLEVAEAMALGLAQELQVDFAISTTGFAGPSGGGPESPVGTVCIGLHHQGLTTSFKYQFSGDREILKERFSQAALFVLLEHLELRS